MLILSELHEGLLVLTINRPEALNALNGDVIRALSEAIQAASTNNDVRALILTGSGEKAFVAGADIKEFAEFNAEQGRALAAQGQTALFDLVEQCPKPVIAAVNGYALGGGLELAMAAHIRIASENALLGLPEVSLGVIPGYGGTQRLPQLVGKGKAMEMILTARAIPASDALACGLVNAVVPQAELLNAAKQLAGQIMKNAPTALSAALKSVLAGYNRDGFGAEIEHFGACFETEDFREGTKAFIAKRKPQFPGK